MMRRRHSRRSSNNRGVKLACCASASGPSW